ncbi:MAG: tetratricopeptide repeat protein [Pirellulales bacterium]|nr:tetratricopeptide repeat protein [Pirellulales bacterium]
MRSRRFSLNVQLMAFLLLLAGAAAVGVYFLHRRQLDRHASFFLEQARAARERITAEDTPAEQIAQLQAAWQNYDRYTSLMPDDLDAQGETALMLADFGKTLYQAGMTKDAATMFGQGLKRLEAVLRDDPDRKNLRRRLVEILFSLRRWSDTLSHAKFLCQQPDGVEALKKFFDREGLWDRLDEARGAPSGSPRLAPLLESDNRTVDREKLLVFLGNDFWRLLDDADLLTICAQCQIALNRPELAEKPLERAVTLAPGRLEAYERLARLLNSRERSADAEYWMTEMLLANPDSFHARRVRGVYRLHRILAGDPEPVESLARGALEDALESVRKAQQQILEKADAASPSNPATQALKDAFTRVSAAAPREPGAAPSAEYHRALLEASRAASALRASVPKIDEQIDGIRDGLILAAQSAVELAMADKQKEAEFLSKAREITDVVAELFPEHALTYLARGTLEQRAGRPDEALAWLRRGRDKTRADERILWRLADSLVQADELDEAATIAKELEAGGASKLFIIELKAEIDYGEGNWLAASKGFEEVLPDLAEWPYQARQVNLMLADCYGQLGRTKDQLDAYSRASSPDRTWLPGLIGLARSKADAGRLDEAIEDYRLIMKLDQAPPGGWIDLARLLLIWNLRQPKADRTWREFEEVLRQVEEAAPGAVDVVVLRAEMLLAQEKPAEAIALLNAARDQLKQDLEADEAKRQGLLAAAERLAGDEKTKKLAEAAQIESQIRLKRRGLAAIWHVLVVRAQQNGDWPEVEKLLDAAQKDGGDTPAIRQTRGQYLVGRFGKDAAPQLRELAENAQGFSPRQRQSLWYSLAVLSYRVNDNEQVETLCRRILEAEPGNLAVFKLQFEVAARDKDVAAMQRVLDDVKRTEKTPSAFWYYGEAARLNQLAVARKDKDLLREAQKSLVQALRLQPANPGPIHLLAAQVHERLGDRDAAVDEYLAAVDAGVHAPEIIQHVARLLAQQERFREADRMFRLLGETQGDLSDETGRQVSSVKAKLGEFEQALAVARGVAKESTAFEDYVWLGQLLTVVGKQTANAGRADEAATLLAEAEAAFKEAVQRKMDEPQTWVALIHFFNQMDRRDEAEAAIAQAARKLPADKAVGALAQCYEALGQNDEAAEQYELALRATPKDAALARRAAVFFARVNKPDKADALLHRIIDGDVEANDLQKAWARRFLAFGLFARGDAQQRKAALAYVEENLALRPDSVEDQYAKAVILASEAGGERRQEAIKTLEDFVAASRNPRPEIQFLLANLCLAEDRWSQYRSIMRSLLRDQDNVPEYVAHFAEMLMAHNELDEAAVWVKKLSDLAPDAFPTLKLRAELAFRQRQFEFVVTLARQWVDSDAAAGPAREERLQLGAALLETFAARLRKTARDAVADLLTRESLAVYREFVDRKPGRKLLLAEFLAGQGRLDEALDVLEKEWPDYSPREIGKTCFAVLQGTNASAEQIVRLDKILRQALDRYDNAIPLQIVQAIVRDYQDRFEDAERIYRDVLKQDPNNPTALNALAVLLALRGVKLDEASRLIDRAIEEIGPSPLVLDSRAIVQLALGNAEAAMNDLNRALQNEPNPVRYFHQAQAFHELGKKKPALDAWRKAHEMGLAEEHLTPSERHAYRRLKIALQ